MRFSLDDIPNFSDDDNNYHSVYDVEGAKEDTQSPCSSPEPSLNEYSLINPGEEDEEIPRLYLPKFETSRGVCIRKKQLTGEDELLNPELEQLMSSLNLQSKLPSVKCTHIIPLTKSATSSRERKEAESTSQGDQYRNDIQSNTRAVLCAMQKSFSIKLANLEKDNRKQVEEVVFSKRKEEEERKRKEEEARLRKEEEDRKRREEDAKRLRQQEEQKKQQQEALRLKKAEEENERRQQEAEQKAQQERQRIEEQEKLKQQSLKSRAVTDVGAIEQTFWEYKEKIAMIKRDIIEPVKKADPNLKSLLSKHKRRVNPKFGQLTNSNQQLQKIQQDLCTLIDDTRSNQLAYMWILNFIAKAMVHQAETEVRVKPESGLPLGRLAVNLMTKYPELKDLLLSRFVKKCPFVIGFSTSIETESGRQNMGWKRKSDDKWEDETSYDERMGGIMTLYAIITRIPLAADVINSMEHPIPIGKSWQLVARICNTSKKLLTNTHFIVLGSWWDAAAFEFLHAYGNQGNKLLQLAASDLTASVADLKYVGAARLRILCEEWQTTGIKPFPEMTT